MEKEKQKITNDLKKMNEDFIKKKNQIIIENESKIKKLELEKSKNKSYAQNELNRIRRKKKKYKTIIQIKFHFIHFL